jgi:DNA-binding XRE family transcriptional regulator
VRRAAIHQGSFSRIGRRIEALHDAWFRDGPFWVPWWFGKEIHMRPTQRAFPTAEGITSRIFPTSPSAVEQVREFLEERLHGALERGGSDQGSNGHAPSLRLTILVLPDHIEVTVGDQGREIGFRDWLRNALRRDGMSQETAARRLGVSLKTVNRWLRGHSEPRMRELRRVRAVFGQPPLA